MHHGWLLLNTTGVEACGRTQIVGPNTYKMNETGAEG